jgi:uncharacterized protein (TIGR02001 family)
MKKTVLTTLAFLGVSALPVAAHAEDAPASDITVTGSVAGVSQYRLRGISQTDEGFAVQGGITVSHKSGFYLSTWASNLAGFGTFGGANTELDAIGGYTTALGKTTLDGGVIWYFYPGTSGHDYGELYASLSHPIGPVTAKVGTNYAFKQSHIGNADNIWVYGELSAPVPGTPVSLRGHLGYTDGKGSIFSGPSGHYLDYNVGADVKWKALTFSLSYVGTNINRTEADVYFAVPGAKAGRDIVGGAAVFGVSAAF